MNILRTSSFWRDMSAILDYFNQKNAEDVALRFAEALDRTIQFIRQFPDLGNPWVTDKPRHAGLRFRLVDGFNSYLVVYQRKDYEILLLRILHAAQDLDTIFR